MDGCVGGWVGQWVNGWGQDQMTNNWINLDLIVIIQFCLKICMNYSRDTPTHGPFAIEIIMFSVCICVCVHVYACMCVHVWGHLPPHPTPPSTPQELQGAQNTKIQ